jgi:hypothetical protein
VSNVKSSVAYRKTVPEIETKEEFRWYNVYTIKS